MNDGKHPKVRMGDKLGFKSQLPLTNVKHRGDQQTIWFEPAAATAKYDSVDGGVRRVSGVLCSALHNFVFEHSLFPFSGS